MSWMKATTTTTTTTEISLHFPASPLSSLTHFIPDSGTAKLNKKKHPPKQHPNTKVLRRYLFGPPDQNITTKHTKKHSNLRGLIYLDVLDVLLEYACSMLGKKKYSPHGGDFLGDDLSHGIEIRETSQKKNANPSLGVLTTRNLF